MPEYDFAVQCEMDVALGVADASRRRRQVGLPGVLQGARSVLWRQAVQPAVGNQSALDLAAGELTTEVEFIFIDKIPEIIETEGFSGRPSSLESIGVLWDAGDLIWGVVFVRASGVESLAHLKLEKVVIFIFKWSGKCKIRLI